MRTCANAKRHDEKALSEPGLDDEERLVEDAKRGRSLAFATLCERHAQRLFRAAHRITRNREDAEDAVQDTLLRAFVHIANFEGRSNFGTWLTSIAINSALMILRKKRPSREIAIAGSNDLGLDGAAYKIADRALNPETRYAQTEEQRILRTAIQRLRPNLRVVVQIHLQGCSMRKTAEALGISLLAAKGRLFHTKKALRTSAIGSSWTSLDLAASYVSRARDSWGRHPNTLSPLGAVESGKKKEMRMSSKPKEHQNVESHATSAPRGEAVNTPAANLPRLEEIRVRAYEIYTERGSQPGHELDDWLQAERELGPEVRHARAGQ